MWQLCTAVLAVSVLISYCMLDMTMPCTHTAYRYMQACIQQSSHHMPPVHAATDHAGALPVRRQRAAKAGPRLALRRYAHSPSSLPCQILNPALKGQFMKQHEISNAYFPHRVFLHFEENWACCIALRVRSKRVYTNEAMQKAADVFTKSECLCTASELIKLLI